MTRAVRQPRRSRIGDPVRAFIIFSVTAAWPLASLAAPYVYVANAGEGTVSVVDAATATVTATIPVGTYTGMWPVDPVLNPSGTRVYVGVQNAVVVIDATTNTVRTTITEAVQPSGGLAIDPSGAWLYVVNYTDPSSVSVVNTVTNEVAAIIFSSGRGSTHMAVSPDGTRGYVTSTIDTKEMDHCQADPYQCPLTVDVLDLTRNTYLTTAGSIGGYTGTDIGGNLRGIAADPAGGLVYVAQWDRRTGVATGVAILSTTPPQPFLQERIPIPAGAYDIAVSPNGSTAYAVGEGGFFVIDGGTYAVTATLPADPYTPARFFSIGLNQSGTRAYVTKLPAGAGTSQLMVIDTAAPAIIDALPAGSAPFGVAVGPDNPPFSPPPTSTPTSTPTATPTPTSVCTGDCDGNGSVAVDEILTMVNVALGNGGSCPNGVPADATVDVSLILQAVNNALNGCSTPPIATSPATATGSPAPTPSPTVTVPR